MVYSSIFRGTTSKPVASRTSPRTRNKLLPPLGRTSSNDLGLTQAASAQRSPGPFSSREATMKPLQAYESPPRDIQALEQRPPHHVGMKGMCLEPWCDPFDESPLSGVKGVDPSLVLPPLNLPTQNPLLGACLDPIRGYRCRNMIELPSLKEVQGPYVALPGSCMTTTKQMATLDETHVKVEHQHIAEANSVPEQASRGPSTRIRFVTERVRNKASKTRARKTGPLQPVSDASIIRRRAHTKRSLSQSLESFVGHAVAASWSGARDRPMRSDYQRLEPTSPRRAQQEHHHRRVSVPQPALGPTWTDLEPVEARRGSCPAVQPVQGKVLLSQVSQELHTSGRNREPKGASALPSQYPIPGSEASSRPTEAARLQRRVLGCRNRRARTAPVGVSRR